MTSPSASHLSPSNGASRSSRMTNFSMTAMNLNDYGALCIENGRFERAIRCLNKALDLTEQMVDETSPPFATTHQSINCNNHDDGDDDADDHNQGSSQHVCQCTTCSLEDYLKRSHRRRNSRRRHSFSFNHSEANTRSSPDGVAVSKEPSRQNHSQQLQQLQQLQQQQGSMSTSSTRTVLSKATIIEPDTAITKPYLYRKPIRISPESSSSSRDYPTPRTSLVALVIIFNLALAYHLIAIEKKRDKQSDCSTYSNYFRKALQLYSYAYQMQFVENESADDDDSDYHDDSDDDDDDDDDETVENQSGSVLFTMIIANNLSQIHKASKNEQKYQLCLQHLLSTIMCWVVLEEEEDENDKNDSWSLPMDGFFRNASKLILQNNVAGAA